MPDDAPADPLAGSLHIALANPAWTPPGFELRVALVLAGIVLVGAGLAAYGFSHDIGPLGGFGCVVAVLFGIGCVASLWSWHTARVLGPFDVTFVDARGPSAEAPGIDCSATFERSRPDRLTATLRVFREDLQYQGKGPGGTVHESFYDETLELTREEAGARHTGRFLVPPVWPLPPSGKNRMYTDRITWQLRLCIQLGKRSYELPNFLRARPPGDGTAPPAAPA